MVVDADEALEASEAPRQPARELGRVEPAQQRVGSRIGGARAGLHGQMHEQLVAGYARRRGLALQVAGVGQEGQGQRAGKVDHARRPPTVDAEVVDDDGDLGTAARVRHGDGVADPGRRLRRLGEVRYRRPPRHLRRLARGGRGRRRHRRCPRRRCRRGGRRRDRPRPGVLRRLAGKQHAEDDADARTGDEDRDGQHRNVRSPEPRRQHIPGIAFA